MAAVLLASLWRARHVTETCDRAYEAKQTESTQASGVLQPQVTSSTAEHLVMAYVTCVAQQLIASQLQ
jgi:hypothetical protein